MTATFYVGDAIEVMNKLPEKSVDLVLTSPPFLALRSYLPSDHPDKALEGGSQATPGQYIDWLVDVVEACDRVLAPHGSLCIELGDTYAGSGGAGGDYNKEGLRAGQPMFRQGYLRDDGRKHGQAASTGPDEIWQVGKSGGTGWPLAKSLSLIPELFRLTLVYGTNPLTGRQTDWWRLRNVVRWVRPNPPVGALGDKFRPATSELMVFCKSAKRYFDLDAVRSVNHPERMDEPSMKSPWNQALGNHNGDGDWHPAGAPPLDWWNIPPGGFSGAHYAVWPPELLIKPIKAMCPEKVCRVCGEPSRRIVEREYEPRGAAWKSHLQPRVVAAPLKVNPSAQGFKHGEADMRVTTTGWTSCSHDDWRPGLVLDPFGGSGTTALVATGHGRDCILIDLDARNFDLALERVGPFILERGNL